MNRSANEQGTAALRGIGRIEGLVADIALLKENLEAVPLWRPAPALAAQCDETVRMIRAIAVRFDRHPVVTVIGPSGSGKSTLVNALAGGRELSPAGHRRPTTGRLLLFGGGPDAAELAAELGPDSVEVLPAAGTALPEGIGLVDTPDTDSMEFQRHLPALERAVAHADVLVCVFDGENPKRRDHADFLAPVVRRFDGESLVAVINKCDRLDEAELKDRILPDARAYLARSWQRPVDRILCTSARRHVQDPGWDPAAGPRHGFDQFDELRALVFGIAGGGGRVVDRRVENARQLHRVMLEEAARELAADRAAARSGLEAFEQAQAQAFEAAVGALRDTDPRRGGGWGAAFYQSLATRWVGPVGWMLALWTRATTLGSGLGALLRWARPSGAERAKAGADGGVSRAGLEPALRGYRAAFLSAWPAVSERLVQARFAPVVRGVEAPLDAAESTIERLGERVGRGRAARNRACGPPAGRDLAPASAQRPGRRGFGDRGVDDGAEVLHRRLPAGRLLHARLLGRRHHPAPELLRAAAGHSSGRLRTGHRPGVCSRAAGPAGGGRRGPAPAEVAAASAARPGGGGAEGVSTVQGFSLALRSASSFSIMATRASTSVLAIGRSSNFPHQFWSAVTGHTA